MIQAHNSEHSNNGVTALHSARPIEQLLEESFDAYEKYVTANGGFDSDFAEFASQAIACFRKALGNPDLSREDLAWALRRASRLRAAAVDAGMPWSSITAACLTGERYINGAANGNNW